MTNTKIRRLESLQQVLSRVPLKRSTLYNAVRKGTFPAPVKISENRVAWDANAIDQWIDEKLTAA